MDCPHCRTSNPLGATNCSKCRSPLGGFAETAVAELTPPDGSSAPTIGPAGPTPPGDEGDVTLDGSVPSSMAIPTAWSVPASGRAAASIASIKSGSLLGNRYEITDILGQGGMGAVYKARDRELDRLVALKVIRPELAGQPEILQRFKQELILARKVTHRNVIRIFDLGDADGVKFITMEFIEGHDLKSILAREGKLAPDQAVKIIQQVCLALEAAHTEGVVHRDLKPQNIMLDQQGRASVMDFGIARSLEFGGMTQTGALIGTPEYMSPEQVRGEHVDERSDLFTLGVIFQEILTGTLPFQAETAMASMFKRTKERAIPVRQLNPAVPQTLSDIVAKCLEIQPQDRFQTAREMYDALEAWKNGAAAPIGIRTLRWARRALRQRGVRLSAAGVTAVAALLLVAVITYQLKKPSKPVVAHAPLSVLVADFTNNTGDPIFDGTLEPMFNVALEGASFINAYNRGDARRLAGKLSNPTTKLDEQAARLVAVSQSVSTIVVGSLSSRGDGYKLSVEAIDAVTGKTLASADASPASKDEVLLDIPKLAAPIRSALGDTTPESVQLAAERGSFVAGNLEAVHQYGIGMEQQFAGNMEGALQSFSKAAELDPNFARAYAGMAAASRNMGNAQEAEKNVKLAMEHVDRMTERERYRIRGLYYVYTGDFPKCIEEYSSLIKLYPSDNIGYNNLAKCYIELHNYPAAIDGLRRALQITPDSTFFRMNLSVLSTYTGDFQTGEEQAQIVLKSNPSFETGYIALAYAQLGQGQLAQAAQSYQAVGKVSPLGASISSSGLADLALYEGRFSEAVRMLQSGADADLAAKDSRAAEKFAMLAYTQLLWGHKGPAVQAADLALRNTQKANVRFMVARVLVQAGETQKARALADRLGSDLSLEAQADSKIIQGEIALGEKDPRKAIQLFTDANKVLDTWIGWFDLGRAYLEAGLYVEADSEFDRCIKGRGQAMDLLDGPTFGYFPPVYYYQGRVRTGLKSPGYAESYRTYLNIRGKAGEDPLLPEIRRLAQ